MTLIRAELIFLGLMMLIIILCSILGVLIGDMIDEMTKLDF